MSFDKFIQYKVLDRIYASDNDFLLDMAISQNGAEAIKAQMKNVCALISKELFDDLDGVCSLLEISKRKFIEYALIEAISRANEIVNENGLAEHYEELRNGFDAVVVEGEK